MDEVSTVLIEDTGLDRAAAMYALAQLTVAEHSSRVAMLERLEDYYFLEGD